MLSRPVAAFVRSWAPPAPETAPALALSHRGNGPSLRGGEGDRGCPPAVQPAATDGGSPGYEDSGGSDADTRFAADGGTEVDEGGSTERGVEVSEPWELRVASTPLPGSSTPRSASLERLEIDVLDRRPSGADPSESLPDGAARRSLPSLPVGRPDAVKSEGACSRRCMPRS